VLCILELLALISLNVIAIRYIGGALNIHIDADVRPDMYDLSKYNDDIIRDLRIFRPDGSEIVSNVYDNLL
jgi:hypothetical protein